jgi:hypothetical protein
LHGLCHHSGGTHVIGEKISGIGRCWMGWHSQCMRYASRWLPLWAVVLSCFLCGCAKVNWGPQLLKDRDPGVIEAPLSVCVRIDRYGRQWTIV